MEQKENIVPMESAQEWETHNLRMDARMVREFTVDESIPEDIKTMWWSLWGKHMVFANLDQTQANILRRRMHVMLERWQQYMPYYKIDPTMLSKVKQIEQSYEALLTRSVGLTRERILQSKQTEEKRIITEDNKESRPGLSGKVRSFFGFGGGGDY